MQLINKVDVTFAKDVTQETADFLFSTFEASANVKITPSQNIFDDIREWAKQRGIYEKGDPKTQFAKLAEEQGELAKAILNRDKEETIDAIGDCVVVLTNLAELCGLCIEDCINSAYAVISERKGKMENGTFVKDR